MANLGHPGVAMLALAFAPALAGSEAVASDTERVRRAGDSEQPVARTVASPKIKAMLHAALPRAVPAARQENSAPPPLLARVPAGAPDVPANGIVRLPSYVVAESALKLPKEREVLTEAALAPIAVREYIPETHRVLNAVSLRGLWKRIPVLGRYELVDHETNEERGLRLYKEAKVREQWANLLSLQSPLLKPAAERDKPR